MGAVCAAVYLFVIIVFIPFPFYKDIVAATSGGGNRDYIVSDKQVNLGRFLHKFPHNKVRIWEKLCGNNGLLRHGLACVIPIWYPLSTVHSPARHWR